MITLSRARRALVTVAGTVALIGAGVAVASPASAAGGGHVDVSDGSSRVVADISFTSRTSFKLTNVTLHDVNCDGRAAQFWAQDDFGALTVHVDSNGCGSSVHWASLSGSSGGAGRISFVQLHVVACNRTGCSTGKNSVAFHNPFK